MDKVAVKKEFYECNAKGMLGSPGICQHPDKEPIVMNNEMNDPLEIASQTQSELYCDITIKSEEIHLPDCIITPEEMQLPDHTLFQSPEEMQMHNCLIEPQENELYNSIVKLENMFLPHEKVEGVVNIQPYKEIIKPVKFEVIEISDDSNDSQRILPLESQDPIQPDIENVKSEELPDFHGVNDFTFSPEKMKIIPGKLAVCSDCGYFSMDFNCCFRCRRQLPADCKVVNAQDAVTHVLDKSKTETDSPELQPSVKEIVARERLPITALAKKTRMKTKSKTLSKPGENPESRWLYRCSECPFVNKVKSKYFRHKKFHRPGALSNFKCTLCSYNVPKQHSLIMHYKTHGVDKKSSSSMVTRNKDAKPGDKKARSERSARKSTVSYAEANSSDDEVDRRLVKWNEAILSERKGEPVIPVTEKPNPRDDPNEWEFISSDGKRQEDDEKIVDSDEFMFCYECKKSWKGECPKHGALITVEDSEVRIDVENDVFAIKTAPSRVRIGNSGTPEKANGIFAREKLPNRLRFGPVKGKLGPPNGFNSYTWLIRREGKPYLCVDLSEPGTSCWWRYMRAAKNVAETNCAVYQYQGRLYVRTIRQILPQEELFVGPYDHNGFLIKYDPELVKKPKVSSWISRSVKRNSEERREKPKGKLIDSKIRSEPESPKSTVQGSLLNGMKDKPFACSFCSKTFRDKPYFIGHILEHTRDKPHECSECEMRFSEMFSLTEHKKLCHSGAEGTKVTEHSLASNSNKKSTTDVHSQVGKQAFVCNVCNQTFRYSFALKKHSCAPSVEKPFNCSVCNQTFRYSFALKKHSCAPSKEKPFNCTECGARFASEQDLGVRSCLHTDEEPFVCRICNEAFRDSLSLKKHKEIHTRVPGKVKPVTCSVCSVQFSNKKTLRVHSRLHTGEKRYVCSVCNESFTHWMQLKKHRAIHAGEISPTECKEQFFPDDNFIAHSRAHSFACNFCTQSFTTKAALEAHSHIHSGGKSFKCTQCTRQFKLGAHLANHIRAHTRAATSLYKYSVCDESFSRVIALRIHERIHKKEKPTAGSEGGGQISQDSAMIQQRSGNERFVCGVCREVFHTDLALKVHICFHFECKFCKKLFRRISDLEKHSVSHKAAQKPFECNVCNKQYSRKDALALHNRRLHSPENPFPSVRDKQFKKSDLMAHVKLHHKSEQLYVCKVCNKGFTCMTTLQIHNRIHTAREKLFMCSECPKRFYHKTNLTVHLRRHSGVRPFECGKCSKTFFSYYHLRRHALTHREAVSFIEGKKQLSHPDDLSVHSGSQKAL